ncbi:MAG: hypothetical protein C0625_10675 [Arcobacter sp.]|nr:MAG: hypothetical protein C0625_10675 [Arcobacter sp.]
MFCELKTVYSEMEAQILMTHLNEENIDCIIDKDDAGGMHPHLQATTGVKILVKKEDLEKAKKIINTKNSEKLGSWICKKCNELHQGQFSVCWNCGEERS